MYQQFRAILLGYSGYYPKKEKVNDRTSENLRRPSFPSVVESAIDDIRRWRSKEDPDDLAKFYQSFSDEEIERLFKLLREEAERVQLIQSAETQKPIEA